MIRQAPYEDRIKARIIDHLLSGQIKNRMIISEVPFSDLRRRVDLLIIGSDLHAIEIKSERDNLNKFHGQLSDYLQFFERFTVYTARCHLNALKTILPESVGLVSYDPETWTFHVHRKSRLRTHITKSALCQFLTTRELRKVLSKRRAGGLRSLTISHLRDLAISLFPRLEMRRIVLNSLRRRYLVRFNIFKSERGTSTHPDDISLLRISEVLR